MIRYFSIACIALFFLQISYNSFVYIKFKVQQNVIALELCEKKDEVINTCKGNCYLKAHLQKQDTQSTVSLSYLEGKAELYFSAFTCSIPDLFYRKQDVYATVCFTIVFQQCNDIFHPPA